MKNLKKISFKVVLFTSLIFLPGCFGIGGGGGDVPQTFVPNAKVFSVEEFDIEYPRNWRYLTSKDFPADVPKETKLVFQSNVKGDFIANVNVGKIALNEDITSEDYAKRHLQETRNGLVNYQEVKSEDIQIRVADGSLIDTKLVVFTGKINPEDSERQFVQTFAVKDQTAYVLTGAMRKEEAESVVQVIEGMLKSLTLK